jgi:hypothetical protein
MRLGLFSKAATGIAILIFVASSGCGHDQQLILITVTPADETVSAALGTSLQIQYTAIGTFQHPPAQKDITNQVVWSTPTPQIVSIDPKTGLATTQDGCGTNVPINATGREHINSGTGSVVVGTATVSLKHPGVTGCS